LYRTLYIVRGAQLIEAARGTDNLMPHTIAAVKGGCTLGEISASMEKVFGRDSPGTSWSGITLKLISRHQTEGTHV